MKKLLALVALVAMVAVSSVALAAPADVAVSATVSSSLTFSNACSNAIALGTIAADRGASGTCVFTAYSNKTSGSEATVLDKDEDLVSGANTWTKLVGTGDGSMATTCTTGCTEAWGFKLASLTGHTIVTDTELTPDAAFDAADPTYHDAEITTGEMVINNAGPVDTTGAFTLKVGAVTDGDTATGVYAATLAVDYVET